MTEHQSVLLQLLSKELFSRPVSMTNADWSEVLQEAKNQAVVQLANAALNKNLLSAEETVAWEQAVSVDIANSIVVVHNHGLLHEWLTDIPYVILKGVASAFYYPVPTRRSMGDVDFLVKTEDLETTGKVLEAHGLKPWKNEHISHIVFRGLRMHYEMHFNLAGTPNGSAGDLVREYARDIFEKAWEQSVGGGTAMLPSPFHHGLVLLLHTCHHLTGEGIGLRHLCDWAVFENSFSEDEFKDLFEDKLKAVGLWRFARILTYISVKYLGADEKRWAEADDELADKLIEDILTGGNFGVKDGDRHNQAYIISSRGKDGVGKTSIGMQLFVSLNDVVYTKWPFTKKWKVFLPAGWGYFGIKHLIRIAKGKRKKIHLKRTVNGAAQRRKLYSQFHLFESET